MLVIENYVCPSALLRKLHSHALLRQYRPTRNTRCSPATYSAGGDIAVTLRLNQIKFDAWLLAGTSYYTQTKRTPAARLLAQPHRTQKWNLCPAIWRLAPHSARPEICNRPRPISIRRVK